jgi:hypothetical protein
MKLTLIPINRRMDNENVVYKNSKILFLQHPVFVTRMSLKVMTLNEIMQAQRDVHIFSLVGGI